jgi:hypothetical protein
MLVGRAHVVEKRYVGVIRKNDIPAFGTVNRPFLKTPIDQIWGKSPLMDAMMRSFPCALARVPAIKQAKTTTVLQINERFRRRVISQGTPFCLQTRRE